MDSITVSVSGTLDQAIPLISYWTPLIQILAGGALSAAGGLLAGWMVFKRQIKAEIEKRKLDRFDDVLENLCLPLQSILEEIIGDGKLSEATKLALKEVLYTKPHLVFLCPTELKKGIKGLKESLSKSEDSKVIKQVKEIKHRIDVITDEFVFKV